MVKKLLLYFSILMTSVLQAQDFSGLWEGHFAYFDIRDVTQGTSKIFAASENAIFSYDINTEEIETITTVNGLSGESISTIKYSQDYQLLIVGYENGLIEIVFDNEEDVLSVVDIIEKVTISPEQKKVNHFNEFEGKIYISTDYGISIYDLERLEFGDSFFIGFGGSKIPVNQTTIFDNNIYAACGNNGAIKKASLDNPNLIDSQQWQTIGSGNFSFIESVGVKLYAINSNSAIFELVNDNLQQKGSLPNPPRDMRSVDDNLLITTQANLFVYGMDFNLIYTIGVNQDFQTQYTSATITATEAYIGTNSLGVLKIDLKDHSSIEMLRPQGPLRNNGFKINAKNNELWMTFGDYTVSFNPAPTRRYGISHLKDERWVNIPYDSLLGATNLNYIAYSPFVSNQVFVSSFEEGLLEINDDEATILYNETNSPLESLVVPGNPAARSIRVSGTAFDRAGVLWTLTSRIDKPLKSFDRTSGQWQSYSFGDLIEDPLNDEFGFQEVVIDKNETKWIAGYKFGVIGFNDVQGNLIKNISTEEEGMPSAVVRALAVDNRSQLWIGTTNGLRVLYNTAGFFEDPNPLVREIVFDDNGIPKELLANQFITDIKVDGSNNKWVGTLDSGVFYFSADGQETIYHFTTDNSPLPSNVVNDISIDFTSGKVFMATQGGLVSFLAGGSEATDELTDAYVYPNPVRPEYNILGFDNLNDINNGVKVKGLTENVNIKITDIEGNLVAEAQSSVNLRSSNANYNFAIDGGTAVWNGRNLANNIVSSGVYLFMISDLDSFETKVLKLLIIR
ncbi:hypothetical protein SAMN03097699_2865 [Flavobacteriaceae bacterium MAR_2010_188]|nr:hypothetical protein SAMN03097699_2865 [Flavobacteriaceae bacterium MAR_2010_188]